MVVFFKKKKNIKGNDDSPESKQNKWGGEERERASPPLVDTIIATSHEASEYGL